MTTERKEEVNIIRDEGYERRQRVVEQRPSTQRVVVSRVSQLIWLFVAVIVGLIAFRFVLLLLGANPASGFANFIYTVTNVFVAPFAGLLSTPSVEGSVIDVVSIVAMIVYLLVGWLLVRLIHILFADSRGIRRTTTVRRTSD